MYILGRDIAQLVECLPSMHLALGLILNTIETRYGGSYAYNPCTQEVEPRGSEVQGHPWVYSKLTANLDYMRTYIIYMSVCILSHIYYNYIIYILSHIYPHSQDYCYLVGMPITNT